MLTKVKAYLRRCPRLWRQLHLWADWKNNVIGETLREGVTPYGFKMLSRNHPANKAMLSGTYELDETTLIQRYLPSIDVFVDVGANIGFYTCLALHYGKYAIAVEPQPRNLKCLYANVISNGGGG